MSDGEFRKSFDVCWTEEGRAGGRGDTLTGKGLYSRALIASITDTVKTHNFSAYGRVSGKNGILTVRAVFTVL